MVVVAEDREWKTGHTVERGVGLTLVESAGKVGGRSVENTAVECDIAGINVAPSLAGSRDVRFDKASMEVVGAAVLNSIVLDVLIGPVGDGVGGRGGRRQHRENAEDSENRHLEHIEEMHH
jgi:hypothetical protein